MTALTHRRAVLGALAAFPVLAALPAGAETESYVLGDIVMGSEDAPVTVIEYASLTCPHCASFHLRTWPEFKEKYVDTGKVRFIMREVYFDAPGLWASMLARCGGEAGFYPMVDQFLKRQQEWSRDPDVAGQLQKIGRINGLSSDQMRACLSDREYAETLVSAYQTNAEEDGIQSTPSFVINGELHTGSMAFDEFSALVDQHL